MCVINVDVNKLYEVYWSVPNVENKVDDIISILSSVKLPSKSTYQGQLSSVITYMNTVKKQTNEIYQSIGGFLDRYSNAEEANTQLAGKLWSGVTSNINGKDETKEYRDYEASKTLEANKVWSSLSYTVQNPLSKHADPRVEPTSVSIYKALYPEEYNKMLEEEKKSLQKDNKTEAAVTMDKVENGANINSTQTSKKKGHNVLANICNSAISGTEQLFKMNEGVQDFASTVRIGFKDYTFVGTGNKFDEILYSKDEYEAKMREKDLSVIAKNKTGAMYDKLYKNSKRVQSINNEADESFKRGGKWYQTVGQVVNGIGIGIISAFSPSAGGSIVASQSVMGMTGNSIENKTNEEKEKSIHGLQEKYENGEISYKELLNAQKIKNMTSEEWSEYVKKYKEGKITKEEYNSSKKIRELNQTYGSKSDFSKLKKYAASQYAYNAVQMGAGIAVGSSKLSTITKVLADTAGNAIDVPFESFLDKKIYNEEFKEAFKKNGGIAGVVQSALIGAGFSIGGEITSFAKDKYSQSKAQKEKSKETNNKTKSVTENEKVVESEPSLKEKRLSEIDDEISKYKKLSAKSAENMKEAKKVGNSDVWALQNSEFAKYTEKIAELEKQRKSLESVDPDVYERDQTKEELAKKKATEETLSKRKSELEEEVGKLTKSTYESLGKIGFVVEEDTIKRIADINKELKEIEGKIETVSSERKALETKMKKIEKKSESKVDVKIVEDTNIKTDTVKESSEKTKHNLNETELSKIDDEISKYKKLLEQSAEYMKDAKKAGDSETWAFQNSEFAKYTEKIAELEKQRKSLENVNSDVYRKKISEIDDELSKYKKLLEQSAEYMKDAKKAGDSETWAFQNSEFAKYTEKIAELEKQRKSLENVNSDVYRKKISEIDDEISKYKKLLEQSAEYMKDAKKAGDSETWAYQNSEFAKYTEKIAELEKQRKSLEEFVPKVDSEAEHVIKRIEIDGESIKDLNSLQNLYIATLRNLKNAGDGDVKIKVEEFENIREKLNKEIEKIEGKRNDGQIDIEKLEGLDNDTKITILRNQLEIKNRALSEKYYLTWLWEYVLGDSKSVDLDMSKKIDTEGLERKLFEKTDMMEWQREKIEGQIEKLEASRTIEGDTIEKLIEYQEKKESLKTEIENLQENSKKLMEAIKEKVESGKTIDVEEYLKWESAVSKISEDKLDLRIVEKKLKTLQNQLASKVKKIEIDGKSIKNLNSLQNLYVSTLRRLKNAGDGDVKIKAEEFEQVREKLNKEIEKIEGKRKDEQIDVELLEKLEGLDNDTKIAILRNQLEIKNRALSEQNYSSWLWESVLCDSESVSLDMSKKINTEKLEKEFQRRTDIIDFEREKIEKQIEKLEASKTIEGDPREKLIEFQEKRKNLKKEIEDLQASSKELMDAIREKVESGKEIDVEEYLKWESAVSKISEDNLDLRIVENKIKTLESNLGAKTKVRDKIKAFLSEAIQKGFGEVKLKKVLYRLNKEYPDELEEIIDSWEKLGDSQKNVVLQEMENLDADYEKILDFKEIINTQKNNIEDVNKNNSSVSENNSNDNFIESDKNTQYTEVTGSNFDDTILNEDYNGYKDNTIEDSQNITKEEVFSLFQDYDKSLYKDSNIEDVITGEYNNDEAFETIFGENYGAKLDIIDEETHENIVSWLIENMNISKEDAEVLINLLDNEDICEYISAVNDIISYFKDKPSLFEYIFGFELYNKTDDGSYVVNDKMLLMDLYFWKNKEILFEENDGKYKIKQDFKDIIENAKNEDEKIDIAKYIKSKNDLITVNTTEDNSLSSATSIEEVKNVAKNIKEKLDTNEEIILNVDRSVEGLNYIDTESDEIYNIEDDKCKKSHVAKLVDISDDGFIISSWGKRLCIKFDEIADNGGISFEINDYEISDENTEEILEELKNNINNKKSQIGD